MEQHIKGAVKSKTIWFNALTAAFVAIEEAFPVLEPSLGPEWYGVVFIILTAGNVALRSITSKPLSDK